ncbi:hypothetical protein FDECE_7909 [Fusarium decemcellulare]|nr:hypothetical protein FDECE_7909 [Fusarium decemcellulare]
MTEFLEEATDILADDGAEAGAETEELSATKVLDSLKIDGLDAGGEVEGGGSINQEVQQGMDQSQQEMRDVVEKLEKGEPGAAEEAQQLQSRWATKFQDVWASAKTFGSFVGVEMAKGALFSAGTEMVKKLLTQPGADPANDERVKISLAIAKSAKILQDALDTWTKWQAAHYEERDSYGSFKDRGLSVPIFVVLQSGISSLAQKRDEMAPLVNKVKQTKTLEAVKALLTADLAYAKAVIDMSNQISSGMTAMMDAGLPTKSAEVQAAYTNLVVVSP